MTQQGVLQRSDKLKYGAGNFAYGSAAQLMSTYLVFFGTAILGVSGALIGTLMAVGVLWDAVTDPLMGYISDRAEVGKWGRRHAYILSGGIGLAVANALLWQIPAGWSMNAKAVLIFTIVIAIKTFMTVYATPYNALGAELTTDYYERTSIQTYRTVFFTVGLAFTTVVGMYVFFKPTAEYAAGQLNPQAYGRLGLTISALVLVAAGITFFGTRHFIPNLPKAPEHNAVFHWNTLFKDFLKAFKNRDYLSVAGGYLWGNIATAILSSVGLHVFTYTFEIDNVGVATLFAVVFTMTVASQGFWLRMTKRFDKRKAVLLAVSFAVAGATCFLIMVILKHWVHASYLWLLPYAILSGIGMGGLITIPFSMIADTVDEEEEKFGIRSEGLYYGGLTFSYKISQSIAIFLLGILLDVVGFDANKAVQGEFTVVSLGLIVSIGSLVALMLSYFFYNKYALTKEKVEATQAEIQRKKMQTP